jgi:ABC-type antimicrobial peptide transport system permease subunit
MLKLAYKNFVDSKIRMVAIIFTIAVALVMLFLCFSYQDIVENQFFEETFVEAENADIRIEYSADASSRLIATEPLSPILDKTRFAIGVLDIYGKSVINGKIEYINLRGIGHESLNVLNNLEIKKSLNRPLRSDEIIVDEYTSSKLNLDIDSLVEITVGEMTQKFFVAKIVKNHPSFETSGAYVIYCMENSASKYIGGYFGNLYNKIFIKSADDVAIDELIYDIQNIPEYANYKIVKENDSSAIMANAYNASLPMIIALALCAVFALYLVYLVVNTSIKRKTLLISRLKSIGASKNYIAGVFILESLMYTLWGLIAGIIISLILLSNNFFNLVPNLNGNLYTKMLVLASFATLISFFISMMIPVFKTNKVSTVMLYKESKITLRKDNKLSFCIALCLLIVSIVLIIPYYLNATRGIIAFLLCFLSIFLLLPHLTKFLFDLIKNKINKSWSYIVANNLAREKMSANSLRIIFAGIVICSILASSAYLISNIKDNIINDIDCDIVITNVKSEADILLKSIASSSELSNVQPVNIKDAFIKVGGNDIKLTLLSCQPNELEKIGKITYITPKDNLVANMDKGIALNYSYHKIYKLQIGDEIITSLNGVTSRMEITAFFNSYQYGGKLGIMSNELISNTFNIPLYDTIIAKTSDDIDTTITMLRADYSDTNIIAISKDSLYSVYDRILENTVMLTSFFAVILIIVCIISVLFNTINSREEKKIEIYKMFSLGFSKKHIMQMEFMEIFITTLCAFFASIVAFPILSYALTNSFSKEGLYIQNPLSFPLLAIIGISFIILLAFSSLSAYFIVDKKKITTTLKLD